MKNNFFKYFLDMVQIFGSLGWCGRLYFLFTGRLPEKKTKQLVLMRDEFIRDIETMSDEIEALKTKLGKSEDKFVGLQSEMTKLREDYTQLATLNAVKLQDLSLVESLREENKLLRTQVVKLGSVADDESSSDSGDTIDKFIGKSVSQKGKGKNKN